MKNELDLNLVRAEKQRTYVYVILSQQRAQLQNWLPPPHLNKEF